MVRSRGSDVVYHGGNRMDSRGHEQGDFIPYPTHRVVGTIVDPKDARAAIEGLLSAGFQSSRY